MTSDTTTQEDNKTIISSGNVELDSRMGGGIPAGSLVLIEGASGAGKSVLSQQILWGGLQQGFTVAAFTNENTVKSMVSQMKSIDLDILDFLLIGKFRVYPIELARLGREAPAVLFQAIRKERDFDIIVVDSFTSAIAEDASRMEIRSFFEHCKRLCATGKTVMITLHSNALDNEVVGQVRSMCDAHLILNSDQDGQRLVKTLQVAKVRGAASVTGSIVGFDVEPGWGMRVIPISKARG